MLPNEKLRITLCEVRSYLLQLCRSRRNCTSRELPVLGSGKPLDLGPPIPPTAQTYPCQVLFLLCAILSPLCVVLGA